jgi:O-antigen ligase
VPALWIPAAPVLVALLLWVFRDPARWFLGFAAATLLLPPLPFPVGETGPHPAVLFAAVGLWRGRRLSEWRTPLNGLTGAAAALILAMLLSVVWALLYSGPAVAAGSAARVLLFGVSLYTLFYFSYGPGTGEVAQPLRWTSWLYALGIASAILACLDFYFQLLPPAGFGEQFVWLSSGVYRRAQGVFYEAGVLGTLCSFFLVWTALAWLEPPPRTLPSKWLAAGAVVLSAALLFSFSRASLLNLLAAFTAIFVLHRGRFSIRRIAPLTLAAGAGALLLTYIVFPAFVETYVLRLVYSGIDFGEKPDVVLGGRFTAWTTIFGALGGEPTKWLFGVGFKTLPYGGLGEPVIADNMYICMLAETGLVGLGAMLGFLAVLVWRSFQAARSADRTVSFLGAWTFCFWTGMLVHMLSVDALTYWRVLPIYFAVAGLAAREHGRYDRGGSHGA